MSKNFSDSKIPILFQEMESQKKSAASLSKATGITQGNISDWKSGKSKPTTAALALVADFLNTTPEYLLGLTDKKEKPTAEAVGKDEQLLDEAEQLMSALSPARQEEAMRYLRYLASQEGKDTP